MGKSRKLKQKVQASGAMLGMTLISISAPASTEPLDPSQNDKFISKAPQMKVVQKQVSPSAQDKIATFRNAQIEATAKVIKGIRSASDGYSDFFVDDGKNPWHEAFTDVITGGKVRVMQPSVKIPKQFMARSASSRKAFIKTFNVKLADEGGYSDFFVDDGKNPWHEQFADFIEAGGSTIHNRTRDLIAKGALRENAVRKLNVIKAFEKIR